MALRTALRGRGGCRDRANERDLVGPRHEVPAAARQSLDYLVLADLPTERFEKLYARLPPGPGRHRVSGPPYLCDRKYLDADVTCVSTGGHGRDGFLDTG